jgi:hypothetical protein
VSFTVYGGSVVLPTSLFHILFKLPWFHILNQVPDHCELVVGVGVGVRVNKSSVNPGFDWQ